MKLQLQQDQEHEVDDSLQYGLHYVTTGCITEMSWASKTTATAQ